MKHTKTLRGFDIIEFEDRNREQCSIQESSIATEECIWLGITDPQVRVMNAQGVPGWQKVHLPSLQVLMGAKDTLVPGRMHLTREKADHLAQILQHFADTGELTL